MDTDAIADSNSFDVSGTSVASLQGFLDGALVISIGDALKMVREYCPGCTPQLVQNTLVANKWEVAQIVIAGFANEDYKCAIRIFTAEGPFPFYKWINAPFLSKVCQLSLVAMLIYSPAWIASKPVFTPLSRPLRQVASARRSRPHGPLAVCVSAPPLKFTLLFSLILMAPTGMKASVTAA
jgi:hypothetical protein